MLTELTNKTIKCKKPHRCTWCGEWIGERETARYRSGVYEGWFFSEYWHLECWDAMMGSGLGYDDEFSPMDQMRGKTFQESHE